MESDFSVFHRVDDPYALPGPVFAARLNQLVHYRGAVRGRALAELESGRSDQGAVPGRRGPVPGAEPGTEWVQDVTTHPAFAGAVARQQ
jgi:hypothetical protein